MATELRARGSSGALKSAIEWQQASGHHTAPLLGAQRRNEPMVLASPLVSLVLALLCQLAAAKPPLVMPRVKITYSYSEARAYLRELC